MSKRFVMGDGKRAEEPTGDDNHICKKLAQENKEVSDA